MNTKNIIQKLEKQFTHKDFIDAIDTNSQGNHFSVIVVSDKFVNLSLINRHKIIYNIFKKEITNEIHALQIKAYTHMEWKNNNNI